MMELIIAHSWTSLNWVHLFEREKLQIIRNFITDREKHFTLEGRLKKEIQQKQQLKLL
jgi:hypothetical protein